MNFKELDEIMKDYVPKHEPESRFTDEYLEWRGRVASKWYCPSSSNSNSNSKVKLNWINGF